MVRSCYILDGTLYYISVYIVNCLNYILCLNCGLFELCNVLVKICLH